MPVLACDGQPKNLGAVTIRPLRSMRVPWPSEPHQVDFPMPLQESRAPEPRSVSVLSSPPGPARVLLRLAGPISEPLLMLETQYAKELTSHQGEQEVYALSLRGMKLRFGWPFAIGPKWPYGPVRQGFLPQYRPLAATAARPAGLSVRSVKEWLRPTDLCVPQYPIQAYSIVKAHCQAGPTTELQRRGDPDLPDDESALWHALATDGGVRGKLAKTN